VNAPASAQSDASSWLGDLLRATAIVVAAVALGVGVNAFSRRPLPLLAADGPGAPPHRFARITVEELREAFEQRRQLMILDVRNPRVFNAGHPFGAQNAHAPKFLDFYPQLAKWIATAETVVILCDSEQCPYSDRVAKILAGHDNMKVLHGGWKAYVEAGLPIEKGGAE